jgi:hypothetical protein
MHVDHCTKMELFDWKGPASPGAAKAMTAVQMPVYESLSDAEIERIGRLVRDQARQASASKAGGSYRVADGSSAK